MKKKSLLLILLLAIFAPFAMMGQETETFALYEDATGNSGYIPVYGNWADAGDATAEFIIPADDISDMIGGTISQMTFFLKTQASAAWNAPYEVYLSETNETTLTGIVGHDDATLVFTGTLNGNSATMDVVFDDDYTYGGGNLLVGFYETGDASYSSAYFKGVATEANTAYYGYTGYNGNFNSTAAQFLPSITFTYEPPQGDCDAPATLTVADPVLAHEATLTWTEGSGTYNVLYKTADQSWEDATVAATNLSDYTITLSGLAANTAYQARVISVCGEETSNPKGVSFTTPIACPAPTDFAVAIVSGDGTKATFSWTNGDEETEWQLCIDGDENNLITMTENPFTYDQFTPEQTYTAKMRAYCDNIDQSTWTNTVTFTPTDAYLLTVNDGTGTNEYVPFYGYYADSGCQGQFIIPAENLSDMQWGTISQLTFYVQNPASADFVNSYSGTIAKFEVYMNETENTTISAVDWSGTKVKNEAQLVITDYKMVVTLDQPYQYMGGNLMIGFKETSNGGYAHTYWYGVTAEGASMGGYGTEISQKNFLPKTTFAYTPGEEPSCYMPTGLAVDYTGGTTATVSWTSDAAAWNMKVNGTPVEGTITNSYALEDLELATTYEIQVQAVCDGSVSDWTPAVSFTTDDCLVADMCAVTIELTDSYSDGWNGGKLEVVNAANNMVLGTYTLESGEGDETFELYVCDGTTINFVYTTGSYPTENGWYITDINDEVIAEHEGCNSGCAVSSGIIATYTMNCTPATCIKPTDFTVVAYGTTAEISWTAGGEETAWQLCVNDDEDNLIDVTENPYTLEGLTVSTDYTVRLRANCGDDDYSNWTNNVSFTTLECEDACAISYVLTAKPYQGSYDYGWLNSGIYVYDADTDDQIAFWTVPGGHSEVTGTLPLCNGREIYFQWYSYYSTSNDNILVGGYAIYDNKGELIAENNGPMSENVEYTMDCSVPSCMWPINFAVEPSYTSAAISWDGSAERGYNVKYRTAPIFFYDGFEYGLEDQGWTTIANGEVPSSGDFVNGWASYSSKSHSGSKSIASRSWVSDGSDEGVALNADNYLITPQLDLQGTLKFYVMCTYTSAPDEFEVLLSTDGTAIQDFKYELQAMAAATGDWQEIEIDLKEYEGQKGYIAIHHVYYNGELLLVDDFGLYGTEEDAGKWQEASTEVASIVLNDLEMDTWYEYLVQGVCEEEESEWRGGEFHTLNGNVKTFSNDGYWNVDENWFPTGVPTANQTAVINAEAIIPAGYVAEIGSITVGEDGSIIVEDGAQLHNLGDAVTVTMEKNITGYGEGNANWYLISSSVISNLEEDDVFASGLINDVPANYDFFEFDGTAEGAEWVNKKDYEYFDMLRGFGYLYANKEDVTLRFTGTAQTYAEGPYWYATAYYLTYDTEKPFGTLNLVGNSLTHDAQLYLYVEDESLTLIEDYYKMYETEEGSKIMLSGDETIAPNEGVFIEATASSQLLVIGAPVTDKGASAMLNIALLSNGSKVDMARVRFGEGNNLTKFQFKADQSKLYIPQNDKDYAVVYGEAAGEMPLNFKAEKIGTYTISFKAEAMQFSYLHLFDKITGTDVDLNVNSEYTFIGTPRDMEDRFIIRFSEGAVNSDIFAYQSGDDIIVNGEGTLQVFDVMGRFVGSYEVNGNARISAEQFSNAVYIFRMIGNEIKTQKIVVR